MAKIFGRWFLEYLCVIVVGHKFLFTATAELNQLPKFSKHTLIQPRFYHGKEKREISTTKQEDGNHAERLIMSYDDEDKNYVIDLQLNKHLITKSYSLKYQKNGKYVTKNNSAQDVELCYYQGKVRGIPDSWASLSTCTEDGLNGIVYIEREKHYFEKAFDESGKHLNNFNFLYKHSDLKDSNYTQPHIKKFFGTSDGDHRKRKYKRSPQQNRKVNRPYNANRQSRYVELLVVVDYTRFILMNKKLNAVERYVLSFVNVLNSLYAPLNIYITLVDILVWTERNEMEYTLDISTTFERFVRYRQEQLIVEHPNDFAVLMVCENAEDSGDTYALSADHAICTSTHSGCVVIDGETIDIAAIHVARELGQALGIEYDRDYCICPDQSCIMKYNSESFRHWSSCSFADLAQSFQSGIDYCLRNKPDFLFDHPSCGNGFVEPGEQCDCGLPSSCNNPCCNATTCMFYTNATCAVGECCDLNICKIKRAGTMCRSADFECDLPEYCTGKSEYCPDDVFKMDTLECAGGKSHCYKGSCRTRSDQCKILWGKTSTPSSEECYSLNTQGSIRGSCEYNKLNISYSKCSNENILCGRLHCRSLDEDLKIGAFYGTISLCRSIIVGNRTEQCCTAKIDFGLNEIDPGVVPDGSKCGESKMCLNQKCVAVADLRDAAYSCPKNCSGHGVCNNLGHCHCEFGFAPPFCQTHGYGGSQDSGPTIDLSGSTISNKPFKTIFSAGKHWYESIQTIPIHIAH